ncbi:MAG: GIY-YIG nuclease family protein [Planctomycetota bacterium]|jgi:predicted GIY-YIG superfamily endonuclease
MAGHSKTRAERVEWCPERATTGSELKCVDGCYYVGHTQDLEGREQAHNDGRAAKFTFLRRPVALVFRESHDSEEDALRREKQIKGWSRAKKEALIYGDFDELRRLSKSRDHN